MVLQNGISMEPTKGLILIPAHNEESSIHSVLKGVQRVTSLPVVVVDSASTDATSTIAKNLGVTVVRNNELGYWQALQCGYRYAQNQSVDWLIQLDADGQHDPIHICRLEHWIKRGGSERLWVWGSRSSTGTFSQRTMSVGQTFFRHWMNSKYRTDLTDISSGFWAINRPVLDLFLEYQGQTADVALRGYALQKNVRCMEIPMAMNEREYGVSMHEGVVHRLRYLRKIYKEM